MVLVRSARPSENEAEFGIFASRASESVAVFLARNIGGIAQIGPERRIFMSWHKPVVIEICVAMEVTGYISEDEVPPEF
ncbi:hypothetical protein GCM10007874_53880 [Labrys miyagiensis]|uniref:Coenzyme PQQ synthesis protein A n=1 Tax=Labrys miyagiensis TaxID=346912 RepID=A0ABQ6CQF5_9HYPH|nr:hypothetical protein GCM10007874_53880 [Labrys miyagiensis]